MRVISQEKCTLGKPLQSHLRVCTEPTCNTAPQEIWFWGQRGASWLCRTTPEPLHIYWELMGEQRRMKIVKCHLERQTWFSSSHNSSSLSLNPDGWWTLWRTVSISLAVCSSSWTTLRISCNKTKFIMHHYRLHTIASFLPTEVHLHLPDRADKTTEVMWFFWLRITCLKASLRSAFVQWCATLKRVNINERGTARQTSKTSVIWVSHTRVKVKIWC